MEAPPLFEPIALVAIDDRRNIRRRYDIHVSRDLFGAYVVEARWGRIGARGQARRYAFADAESAKRQVTAILARRASASRRMGTCYQPVPITGSGE